MWVSLRWEFKKRKILKLAFFLGRKRVFFLFFLWSFFFLVEAFFYWFRAADQEQFKSGISSRFARKGSNSSHLLVNEMNETIPFRRKYSNKWKTTKKFKPWQISFKKKSFNLSNQLSAKNPRFPVSPFNPPPPKPRKHLCRHYTVSPTHLFPDFFVAFPFFPAICFIRMKRCSDR